MAGFIYDALVIYKVYKLQDNIDFSILCYTTDSGICSSSLTPITPKDHGTWRT